MTTPLDRSRTLRVAALLLGYPDEQLTQALPLLHQVAPVTGPAAEFLQTFLAHLDTMSLTDAQLAYVDTFDLRRRCCLYLTYYSYGDTRKRGVALLRFTTAYKAAGFTVADGELPDHLAVVCEFTAAEPASGLRLLRDHRTSLELLHLALADAASPYLQVVEAIRSVLPEPAPRDLDRALALAETGPPAEEVGLEPFAPPEYMGGRR